MSEEKKSKSIRDEVLEAIKAGRVAMRPRWQFALRLGLVVVGVVLALTVVWYLASLAIFVLRDTGAWFGPEFGRRGWYVTLRALPWVVILFALVFVVILEILVRRFAFSYRQPLLYSLGGVVLIVFMGSIIVARTSLHGRLLNYAEQNRLPLAGPMYRKFHRHVPYHIYPGTIVSTTSEGFMIVTRRGDSFEVFVTTSTRFPNHVRFMLGDEVAVFGDRVRTTINAFGIQPFR